MQNESIRYSGRKKKRKKFRKPHRAGSPSLVSNILELHQFFSDNIYIYIYIYIYIFFFFIFFFLLRKLYNYMVVRDV